MGFGELVSAGAIGAVVIGILNWISKPLNNFLKIRWKHTAEKGIAKDKSYDDKAIEIIKSSLGNLNTGVSISHEKRLDSVDKLWSSVLEIRDYSSPLILFYTIFLPDEYNEVAKKHDKSLGLDTLTDESTNTVLNTIEIEACRPYLGEYIWGLYKSYITFTGRLIFLYLKQERESSIKSWNNDNQIKKIVMKIMDIDEKNIEIVYIQDFITIFEQKILLELERVISGQHTIGNNIEEGKKLIEIAEKMRSDFEKK
ncbi:hypothetical protein [Halobacillus halophilus]|uniref:hypothetical protein n=1 Tax=Halobacillus halophilus TaxID=1570 RepID=UPI001CD6BF4B|nr:hypothetical protein [Halobacillus halophilus]MCA1011466.1 hypothetical protein [Halobacillus halophilus]